MVRLRVFGLIELQDANGRYVDAVLAQPKRLAFLVYLAASPQRFHRRESLLALFWPELDTARARDALNSTVRFLRRSLGADVIVSRGAEELGVDPARLWCDVSAFRDHVDAARLGDALELYRADLVSGVFPGEGKAFEEWLDRERTRLRALAAKAARTLAESRERESSFTTAVSIARRAVELSNTDERVVRQLLELLDRLGDRAGALHAYEEFATRLARDVQAEPAPETKALIERIRLRSVAATHGADVTPRAVRAGETRRIGAWQIVRELGQGGMSTVYLARDLKHDRHVALKTMRPDVGMSLGTERFLREIQITAQLAHPHILPLIDSGAAEDTGNGRGARILYLVTPYVPGESLRARLARDGRLPLADALRIASEVAEALDYAHRSGIIHRDIKPENILLADGHAIVADFGIARALLASGSRHDDGDEALLVGSPPYMSPEAVSHGAVDARTDVYSLGCVLGEMLTGQAGPAQMPEDVPGPVRRLVADCLATRAGDRPASAADVLRRLAMADNSPAAAPRRRLRGRRTPASLVGIALVATVVVLYGAARRHPTMIPLANGPTTKLTSTPGLELDPAISPDGKLVAYAAGTAGGTDIYVRQLAGGRVVKVSNDDSRHHRWPAWSPDGSQIAYIASTGDRGGPSGRVFTVPALSGSPRLIADTLAYFSTPAWSPDGRLIAYSAIDSIVIRGVDDGSRRTLRTPMSVHSLAWSPNGKRIAFVSGNPFYSFATTAFGNLSPTSIWTIGLEDSAAQRVTQERHVFLSPTWMPDSRGLLYVSNDGGAFDVYHVRLDEAGRAAAARRLTTGLNVHGISLSPDGGRLAYSVLNYRSNIFSAPISAAGPTPSAAIKAITDENQTIETADVSWDGKWLVFDSNRDSRSHLYKMPVGGGEPIRLTSDTTDDFAPRWSPDGKRIAFHSRRVNPRDRDVYVMNADGGDIVRITTDTLDESYPNWSADGRSIYFAQRTGGLMTSRLDDDGRWSPPSPLAVPGGGGVHATRDGRYLVRHHRDGLYLINADGAGRLLLARGKLGGHWSTMATGPNADEVYLRVIDSVGVHSFYSVPLTGQPPRLLLRLDGTSKQPARIIFSTDGRRLYFTLTEAESDIWIMALTGYSESVKAERREIP